jgi:hypothetical protein
MEAAEMKKMTWALSAVTGLAVVTMALVPAVPSAAQMGTAPVSRCTVIDVGSPGTSSADRVPVKQVVPLWCL